MSRSGLQQLLSFITKSVFAAVLVAALFLLNWKMTAALLAIVALFIVVVQRYALRPMQKLGRKPTEKEIARKARMSVEKVREIIKVSQVPLSLEMPIGDEESSRLGDFVEDISVQAPDDVVLHGLLRDDLEEVMSTLTDREKTVLKLRFGIEDGHPSTLEEVGRVFNVTRERIRQIEAKALRKLKHPTRARKLREYLK